MDWEIPNGRQWLAVYQLDAIWSPTASTSDLQVAPACKHFWYAIRSSASVDLAGDMEMFVLDNQGTLSMNDHQLTVYSDFINDGTLNSGTSLVTFAGDERLRAQRFIHNNFIQPHLQWKSRF